MATARDPTGRNLGRADYEAAETRRRDLVCWIQRRNPRWTWFATLTFRTPTRHSHIASSRLRSWLTRSRIPSAASCKSLLWSAERHVNGSVHLHALLECSLVQLSLLDNPLPADPGSSALRSWSYQELNDDWYHHHGIARFHPFDEERACGGITYVVKYVMSESCIDWNWWFKGKDW